MKIQVRRNEVGPRGAAVGMSKREDFPDQRELGKIILSGEKPDSLSASSVGKCVQVVPRILFVLYAQAQNSADTY